MTGKRRVGGADIEEAVFLQQTDSEIMA